MELEARRKVEEEEARVASEAARLLQAQAEKERAKLIEQEARFREQLEQERRDHELALRLAQESNGQVEDITLSRSWVQCLHFNSYPIQYLALHIILSIRAARKGDNFRNRLTAPSRIFSVRLTLEKIEDCPQVEVAVISDKGPVLIAPIVTVTHRRMWYPICRYFLRAGFWEVGVSQDACWIWL